MTDKTNFGFSIPDSVRKIAETTRFKVARIGLDEIKAMPDEELLKLLNGETETDGFLPISTQQVISSELLRRQLERGAQPHWTTTPSFWILIVGTLAACIAAYPVVSDLFQSKLPADVAVQASHPSVSAGDTASN